VEWLCWHDRYYVVTDEGTFLHASTGAVACTAPPYIRHAVIFKDKCYLFFDKGGIKVSDDGIVLAMEESVQPPASSDIQIYPNPVVSTDQVFVSIPVGRWSVALYDVLGTQLAQRTLDEHGSREHHAFRLSGSGVFMLIARNPLTGEQIVKRILKQ